MKTPEDFYASFEKALMAQDIGLALEFREITRTRTPLQVFGWLEELRRVGNFPASSDEELTAFFWNVY